MTDSFTFRHYGDLVVNVQLVCLDAGGTLGPVNIVADLVSYQYNPYSQSLVSTNAAECMRQHLTECVEFIADLHTINKVKVINTEESQHPLTSTRPHLNSDVALEEGGISTELSLCYSIV